MVIYASVNVCSTWIVAEPLAQGSRIYTLDVSQKQKFQKRQWRRYAGREKYNTLAN